MFLGTELTILLFFNTDFVIPAICSFSLHFFYVFRDRVDNKSRVFELVDALLSGSEGTYDNFYRHYIFIAP